jgi:hypothetical protein
MSTAMAWMINPPVPLAIAESSIAVLPVLPKIIIFGKKDSTAIDLSAIASGSGAGGFVINGENVDDPLYHWQ